MNTKAFLLPLVLGATAGFGHATLVLTPVSLAGATASESSDPFGFPASRVIDGNVSGYHPDFNHTGNGANEWVRVALPANANVDVIRVYNRSDCCSNRLDGAVMRAFSDAGLTTNVFTSSAISGAPRRIDFALPSTQSVRALEISQQNQFLHVGEIQLFTRQDVILPLGTNLTAARLANLNPTMSSAWQGGDFASGGQFPADLAVDTITGNGGNFSHTAANQIANQWWNADLGETMRIQQVQMENRVGCCGGRLRDITVTVLDAGGATLWTSPLLNQDNALGGGAADWVNGPSTLSLDIAALNGGNPVLGNQVRITRTLSTQPDGGDPNNQHILAFSEVNIIGGTIPEPATSALALLAAGLFATRRRRD